MTKRSRSTRIPDSAWRYIWRNFDLSLAQTPAMVAMIVIGVSIRWPWLVVVGSVMLGVVAVWTIYLYRLHGLLLASQQRMDAAEVAYRADMAKAGAPVSLVDQIVAHVHDSDLGGAMRLFNEFMAHRP